MGTTTAGQAGHGVHLPQPPHSENNSSVEYLKSCIDAWQKISLSIPLEICIHVWVRHALFLHVVLNPNFHNTQLFVIRHSIRRNSSGRRILRKRQVNVSCLPNLPHSYILCNTRTLRDGFKGNKAGTTSQKII